MPRHHAVQVPATTANLGAGFDAFGLALDRHLAARTVPVDSQPERVRHLDDHPSGLPTGDDNLIWTSLVAFCEEHGVEVPDVAITTRCAIPAERGLGSSSAAIVAGLTLGRALTGVPVGDPDLVRLADRLEGHPDNVAPALLGGLVACARDDAGDLVVRRVNPTPVLRPVALVPEVRSLTATTRETLPEALSRADVTTQVGRAGHVLAALTGTWPVSAALIGDRLHEPVQLAEMGPSGKVLATLRADGVHAWLSGAGPSVVAAVPSADASTSAAVVQLAGAHGFTAVDLQVDLAGALCCPDDGCGLAGRRGCPQCPAAKVDGPAACGGRPLADGWAHDRGG